MGEFKLYWDDAEEGDDFFAEIELSYCPRVGERIWFEEKDEDSSEVTAEVAAVVQEVMHVTESEDTFSYVELVVKEESRSAPKKVKDGEELDDRGCPCSFQGTVDPKTRERIFQAAMRELRLNEKKFGGTRMVSM